MYPLFNSRLLASITRANNMLLIWLQEAVSRQLNFQLLSHDERMHKTYLYLSCMKAGSDAHIPVSCNSRIKRNVNRSAQLSAATHSLHSGNLLLVSPGVLTSTWKVRQSAGVPLIAPCKKPEYGAAGQVSKGAAPCPPAPGHQPSPAVGPSHCCQRVPRCRLCPPNMLNTRSNQTTEQGG